MIQLFHGDCLDVMKGIKTDSIDSLVTDPPAGINFMGKQWDSDRGGRAGWVSAMTVIFREVHRVLKPGAHGLVWAIPRTSHWTATALENAGFEIRDIVQHLFGQGFPKSLDISKQLDKIAGVERQVVGRSDKGYSDVSGRLRMENNYRPKDYYADCDGKFDITVPTSDQAKKWAGYGTALKPACEHWILIRKPLSEKSVASNILKHGVGGINVDASRVASTSMPKSCTNQNIKGNSCKSDNADKERDTIYTPSELGRFPSNVVFSHNEGCEEECEPGCSVKMLDDQSGILKSGALKPHHVRTTSKTKNTHGERAAVVENWDGNEGGASRFFYCAKISSSERGEGNNHPTVKTKKLMSYLIRMVTPNGGIVLDPFMGSGSTGLAAKDLGFRFVGIEREKDYFDIAKKRVES